MWFNIPFSFQVAQVLFSWKTPQKLNVNVIESRNWHLHSRKSRLPGFFVWEFPGVFGGFGETECLDHQPTLPSPDCIRLSHILSIGSIWSFTIHWHRRKYWYDEFIKLIKPLTRLTPYIPIGWNRHWTAPNAPLMEYWRLNCPTNCWKMLDIPYMDHLAMHKFPIDFDRHFFWMAKPWFPASISPKSPWNHHSLRAICSGRLRLPW